VLLALYDGAGQDVERFRNSVKTWFDDSMDRVSGWYKRKVQLIVLALTVALCLVLNLDTFSLAISLWGDSTERAAVVSVAQQKLQATPHTFPVAERDGERRG